MNGSTNMQVDDAKVPAGSTVDDTSLSRPNDRRSNIIREGDYMILIFADGRQIFAQALKSWKGKSPPVKINKRSYPTYNLLGLPYGTVLELGPSRLTPLPEGEDIIPEYRSSAASEKADGGETAVATKASASGSAGLEAGEANAEDTTFPTVDIQQKSDNRHLVDSNDSQRLAYHEIEELRKNGAHGSQIIDKLIENSATFDQKTEFSKAKWIARKQKKHQPRCRIVRCTPFSVCEAIFRSRPRNLLNMREDTLGQILSYSNVCAGCQVLVFEQCCGVLTGALAHRLGGYGKVVSVYQGQQPSFLETLTRYNLSFEEQFSIKWVHSSDIFARDDVVARIDVEVEDPEKTERETLEWPCPLQGHTRSYLENMGTVTEKKEFLAKRCARFARKLTRHTPLESKQWLENRKSDSIILAVRYDPTSTLLEMLPFLAPSSPFVVFCEYIEPLAECFRELQKQQLAINLRLSDTWMREYQVLPGRTHPNMSMSQSGGFILTGIKLCPKTGKNELDDELIKEIRSQIGGRRGRKSKAKNGGSEGSKNGKKRSNPPAQNEKPSKKVHKEDVYQIGDGGDQFVEIRPPAKGVSEHTELIEASCVCVEPKACNTVLKDLAKCLPLEAGLIHLKRVQKGKPKGEASSNDGNDNVASSPKRAKMMLKVLLGTSDRISSLHNGAHKPENNKLQTILSLYGPLQKEMVPKCAPQSEEEWMEMNAIWPTQYQPLKTEAYHRQRQALSTMEIEKMQQHIHAAMEEKAVLIVDPTTNNVVSDARQEFVEQSKVGPSGFIDNCLATPISLAIQGISRTERQNQLKEGSCGKAVVDSPTSNGATQQRRQYLCTGYDMYCFYEPSVFEAMSCLHSRLRRLVYCGEDLSGATSRGGIRGHGCSKYHIHDLPGTNHRYRVFEYHATSK